MVLRRCDESQTFCPFGLDDGSYGAEHTLMKFIQSYSTYRCRSSLSP